MAEQPIKFRTKELNHYANKEHEYKSLVGKLCYVKEKETEQGATKSWATAQLQSFTKEGVFAATLMYDTSKTMEVPFKELMLANEYTPSDLCDLEHAHEPGIITNIGQRFVNGLFFTSMGPGLVFVNPGSPHLYLDSYKTNDEVFNNYATKKWNTLNAPHVYSLAQDAYDIMCFARKPQTIVVSGDNGSGKSECVNSIIDYMLFRSHEPTNEEDPRSFDNRLRCSAVILESFGNARIGNNSNSTRFGKYSKLCFERDSFKSAVIETFLLEKQRVIRGGPGERSFHIFYQLLHSVDEPGSFRRYLKHLRLGEVSEYMYLNQEGQPHTLDDEDPAARAKDGEQFDILVEAMAIVGFSPNQIQAVLQTVAAILCLGNVEFVDEEEEDEEDLVANVANPPALQKLANALAVDVYDINNMLTEHKVEVKGKAVVKRVKSVEAYHIRDWVAKSLYESMFLMITDYINSSLDNSDECEEGIDSKHLSDIAIVDLCGLGDHEMNEFEHFLINYANEIMHQTYLHQVFDVEIKKLEAEGIQHDQFTFDYSKIDNSGCIAVIDAPQKSIFSVLNAVCMSSKQHLTDDIFLQRLQEEKYFDSSSRFYPIQSIEDRKHSFAIKHYNGTVKYLLFPGSVEASMGVKGNAWTCKNHDETPFGLVELIRSSKIEEIARVSLHLPSKEVIDLTCMQTAQGQINSIRDVLKTTNNLHVHCIASNPTGAEDVFDNVHVTKQLHALHLVESTQVYKTLYPLQISFKRINASLGDLETAVGEIFRGQHETMLIACILIVYQLPHTDYKIGKSVVFFQLSCIDMISSMLAGPTTDEDQDELLDHLAQVLEKVHEAGQLVSHMESEMKDFRTGKTNCLNQLAAFDKMYDKAAFGNGRKPTTRLLDVRASVDQTMSCLKTIDTILDNLNTGIKEARAVSQYGHFEDVNAIYTEFDVRMEVLVAQLTSLTKFLRKADGEMGTITQDIEELEQQLNQKVKDAEKRFAYKMEQQETLSEAMVSHERSGRLHAEERAKAEAKARKELEEEKTVIAAEKEALRLERELHEKEKKLSYTVEEARQASMNSIEVQNMKLEMETARKEQEFLSEQAKVERDKAEAARKKANQLQAAFMAKEESRLAETQAILQKEKELSEAREKDIRDEAERKIAEESTRLAEIKLQEVSKQLQKAHERELYENEQKRNAEIAIAHAKIKELEDLQAKLREKEQTRAKAEITKKLATDGEAAQRDQFTKYVKKHAALGEDSVFYASSQNIKLSEESLTEEKSDPKSLSAMKAELVRLQSELPLIELEHLQVQARLERAQVAAGILKTEDTHYGKLLNGDFTVKYLTKWQHEEAALKKVRAAEHDAKASEIAATAKEAELAQQEAKARKEAEEAAAAEQCGKVSTWILANSHHITREDAAKYARVFYDNKLKVVARIARKLHDDPDFILAYEEFDQYDTEELTLALTAYYHTNGSEDPLSPTIAGATMQKRPFANNDATPATPFVIAGANPLGNGEDDEPDDEPEDDGDASVFSQMPTNLPQGWTARLDSKSGKIIYKNEETGKKTSRRPEGSSSPSKSSSKDKDGDDKEKRSSRRSSTSSTPEPEKGDDEKRSSRRSSTSSSKRDGEESTSGKERSSSSRDKDKGGDDKDKNKERSSSKSSSRGKDDDDKKERKSSKSPK